MELMKNEKLWIFLGYLKLLLLLWGKINLFENKCKLMVALQQVEEVNTRNYVRKCKE